jgi:hypothetical protein
MLDISEAYRCLPTILEHKNLKGIIVSNSLDKSFGRAYFRTTFNFIGLIVSYRYSYISYRVYEYPNIEELLFETKRIQALQLDDINDLLWFIKANSDVNLQVSIVDYDYIYNYYLRNLHLTGQPILEILEPIDDKYIQMHFDNLRENQRCVNSEYCQKMEIWKERERISHLRENHMNDYFENFDRLNAPNQRLIKLEEDLNKINSKL